MLVALLLRTAICNGNLMVAPLDRVVNWQNYQPDKVISRQPAEAFLRLLHPSAWNDGLSDHVGRLGRGDILGRAAKPENRARASPRGRI